MAEGALKSGWTWVKFGDVVKLNKDRCKNPIAEGIERYVGLEHITPEDLRIQRWGLVAEGTTFTNYFQPGQVLFGKRRAYQRKVAVADFEGICSSDIYVFEPKDDKLLPELLPFICQTEGFFAHAVGTSAGSLSPRTNWKQLAKYEFALPPLEEQRRASKVLEAYENTYNALDQGLESAKNIRKSLALHAFQEDLPHSHTLETVLQNSLYGPRFSNKLYDDQGKVGQVRTTDIDENGDISYETIPRTALDPLKYKTHILQDGDLLISRSGTCGMTAVFREQTIPIIAAAFLIRLRTNDAILPEYLHEFFCSSIGRQLTTSLARGGVQKNISGSKLLKQKIPCPSNTRQIKVVKKLTSIRSTERRLLIRLQKTRKLKQSFLTRLIES